MIFLCNPDRLLIKYCSIVSLGCYYVFFCYIIFVPSYYFSVVSHLLPTESICSGQNIKGSRNTELSEALLLVWINPVGGFAYALTPCSANQIVADFPVSDPGLVFFNDGLLKELCSCACRNCCRQTSSRSFAKGCADRYTGSCKVRFDESLPRISSSRRSIKAPVPVIVSTHRNDLPCISRFQNCCIG